MMIRFLLGLLVLGAPLLAAPSPAPSAAVEPPPRRPNFEPPRFFVALRVPPSTSSRAAAFTIPVEVAELHPRDAAQAAEVDFLMPAQASPSDPIPLRWDFGQGLGQLLRLDSPVPCRAFVLRPDRMSLPTIRSVIGSAAPKVRRDRTFTRQLANLGLAVYALKEGESLQSVFPGIPMDKGTGKLGNTLTQVHYRSAFATITPDTVGADAGTGARPVSNVLVDSPYKFEALDPVFVKMLNVAGYSPTPETGDGVTVATAKVADVLKFGEGRNADDRNNKRRIFEIKLDMGLVPRPDALLEDITAKVGADPGTPTAYRYRLWPFAAGDGIVDFGGFVQPAAGSSDMEINVSLLATCDPAEVRAEVQYLTLKAWRARSLLDAANHLPGAAGYKLAQALLRLNEPLWEYLVLRRVLQHMGPRVKVFGDELVPSLDPVSARIWEERRIRAEAFVNAPESAREVFEEYPAGQDADGFFPLRADPLQYEMNRVILLAMQSRESTLSIVDQLKTTSAPKSVITPKDLLKLQKKLSGEVVDLLARGFHRPWRPLPLKDTLAAAQPGRGGYTGADPQLEPDLVWLARATSGAQTFSTTASFAPDDVEFIAGDASKDVNGFVRPLMMLSGSPVALGVQALVDANIVAVEYTAPAKLPDGSYFRFLYQAKQTAPLLTALTYAKAGCKLAQESPRVKTSATGRAQGWSQAWFDQWQTSEGKTPATSQLDIDTFHYYRLTTELDKAIVDGGLEESVDPQYVVVKPAAALDDGLAFAGKGAETKASKAVRDAVKINLELIKRLHPVGDDSIVDAAVQRALVQQNYLDQSVLTALKPAEKLLADFWTASLIDWVPHNELWFRTMGNALGAAIGGKVRVHRADRTTEEL